MPQISKMRIVNLIYDNDTRIIPDRIFDFTDVSSKPVDSLIELINGGGKTTIIQMLASIIYPKAKVQERSLKNFFKKPGLHSYILLEWEKENEGGKLLTGISIASSAKNRSVDSDSEDENGVNLRYYMFTTEYDKFSMYSIDKLELSSNKKGFKAYPYDYVRNLAIESKGMLTYYSSDDYHSWSRKLREYGIYTEEWADIILPINIKESDGIIAYFKKCNTSNKLLDEFLIPLIDKRIAGNEPSEYDASITSMLIDYSKKISEKEAIIEECENSKNLLNDIKMLGKKVDELKVEHKSLSDQRDYAYGFKNALEISQEDISSIISETTTELENIDQELTQIHHEKLSKDLYDAEYDYRSSCESFQTVSGRLGDSKSKEEKLNHEREALLCADIYRQFVDEKSKNESLRLLKRSKEQDIDINNEIASCKYSAKMDLEAEKEKVEESINEYSCSRKERSDKLNELKGDLVRTNTELTDNEKKLNECNARRKVIRETLGNKINNNNLPFSRKLDDFYTEKEFVDYMNSLKDEQVKRNNRINNIANVYLKDIDKKRDTIKDEKFDLEIDIKTTEQEKAKLEKEVETYNEHYSKMVDICNSLGLDVHLIFSDKPLMAVETKITEIEASQKKLWDKLKVLDEKSEASKGGFLHLLPSIRKYVDDTGLDYQTGESYIYRMYENGSISEDKMKDMLEKYPAIAYSLVFNSDNDIAKLLQKKSGDWLPAIAPLYSMQQINDMLNDSFVAETCLANYDRDYFVDKDNFLNNLKKKIDDCHDLLSGLSDEWSEYDSYRKIINSFSYTGDWLSNHTLQMSACDSLISTSKNNLSDREIRYTELEEKKKELNKEYRNLLVEKSEAENRFELCKEIIGLDKQEHELYDEYQKYYQKVKDIKSTKNRLESDIMVLEDEIEDIEADISSFEVSLTDILSSYKKVMDAEEADIVEGTWNELIIRYENLVSSLSEDIAKIDGDIELSESKMAALDKRLSNSIISEEEYSKITYSADKYERVENNLKEVLTKIKELEPVYKDAYADQAKAEGRVETCKKALSDADFEPLSPDQIGSDFKSRTKEAKIRRSNKADYLGKLKIDKDYIINTIGLVENFMDQYTPVQERIVKLEKPSLVRQQWGDIRKMIENVQDKYQDMKAGFVKSIGSTIILFDGKVHIDIIKNLRVIKDKVESRHISESELNYCYTGLENLGDSVDKLINLRQQTLSGIKEDFDNMVEQCMKQAEFVYKDLRTIASTSKVEIFEGRAPVQLVKIGLPDKKKLDENVSRDNIENEIRTGAEIIKGMFKKGSSSKDIKEKAKSFVNSNALLHKYTGQATIPVHLYKIDLITENSLYVPYEYSVSDKSGGEGTVSFFALIMAAIYYSRSKEGIRDKSVTSVIPMDNPFGTTNAEYLLKPMFAMARYFNVQLLCFTGHDEPSISQRFSNLIVLKIAQQAYGNVGVLYVDEELSEKRDYSKMMALEKAHFKEDNI